MDAGEDAGDHPRELVLGEGERAAHVRGEAVLAALGLEVDVGAAVLEGEDELELAVEEVGASSKAREVGGGCEDAGDDDERERCEGTRSRG